MTLQKYILKELDIPFKKNEKYFKKYIEKHLNNPNFIKWFGNSKITDSIGNPLVVFHSSEYTFANFDKGKLSKNTQSKTSNLGFFFTEHISSSQRFGKNVYPFFLKIENPINAGLFKDEGNLIDFDGFEMLREGIIQHNNKDDWESIDNNDVHNYVNWQKSRNKDGMIIKTKFDSFNIEYEDVHVYKHKPIYQIIVFEPNQVKSIFNNGDFDLNNPSFME